MIWRGPMVMGALEQMMGQVEWGALDIMIVDMPPGTGDAQLTMAQRVTLAGAVIVSTPQDIALIDARRGVRMFERTKVPVLGLIENMSMFTCPNCGHESHIFGHGGARAEATRLGVEFLGEIPLLLDIRTGADAGTPIVAADPDGPAAAAFNAIAQPTLGQGGRPRQPPVPASSSTERQFLPIRQQRPGRFCRPSSQPVVNHVSILQGTSLAPGATATHRACGANQGAEHVDQCHLIRHTDRRDYRPTAHLHHRITFRTPARTRHRSARPRARRRAPAAPTRSRSWASDLQAALVSLQSSDTSGTTASEHRRSRQNRVEHQLHQLHQHQRSARPAQDRRGLVDQPAPGGLQHRRKRCHQQRHRHRRQQSPSSTTQASSRLAGARPSPPWRWRRPAAASTVRRQLRALTARPPRRPLPPPARTACRTSARR